jgi:epoxyqueuosine reductase
MEYLARHRDLRRDPRQVLPGAKSIIVVADAYRQPDSDYGAGDTETSGDNERRGLAPPVCSTSNHSTDPPTGRIARYAWGRDYHRVLRKKLHRLIDRMREVIDVAFEARACVDTAPVVEREWAAAAGVGWIGKNTMVLHESIGSFFFLGEIVTTLELVPSAPAVDRCGTCTRCLQACPTGALVGPYEMDARRCISYLTIEHRGDIDADLQPLMGEWVYGCDICQDVCPHNRKAPATGESAYLAGGRNPLPPRASLPVLQNWTPEDYARDLAGSAMKRATLPMLQRNAAIISRNRETSRLS